MARFRKGRKKRLPSPVLGLLGTLVIVFVLLASMNFDHLPLLRNDNTITVQFPEAAGLKANDEVRVSGAKVGKVDSVHLDHGKVVATLALDSDAPKLGSTTRANIVTVTLLGRMAVQLVPSGSGELRHGALIPLDRTTAPYDINSDLNQLTDKSASIDKTALSNALRTVSDSFAQTPNQVRTALTGVEKLADAVGDNDASLQSLLDRASRVTGVLDAHNARITSLLKSGDALLSQLDSRQQVVVDLLHSANQLATQLRAVLSENDKVTTPALTQLNKVIAQLNRNKSNLQQAITGLRNYATAFNEAVATGPFFDAFIQNLTSPGTLAPILSGALQ